MFTTRSILFAFFVVALWLSTFAGYRAADGVRAFIMLSILITSGVAALSFDGRRRAFWIGFFGTLLAMQMTKNLETFGADFRWVDPLTRDVVFRVFDAEQIKERRLVSGTQATVMYVAHLAAASIVGLMCIHVYDSGKRRPTNT